MAVDNQPTGHIYRWHGNWYAVAPGAAEAPSVADREIAAAQLVELVDAGSTMPQPANQTPQSTTGLAAPLRTLDLTKSGRHPLPRRQRREVAGPARRLPAVPDGLRLLRPLGQGRSDHLHPRPAAAPPAVLAGKHPNTVSVVLDSQSVKGAETVGRDSCGYDAGKKINGRKRHLAVDHRGLPISVMVTPADLQDRDAARDLLFRLRLAHPELTIAWADSAYAGTLVTWADDFLAITLKTVSRPKGTPGFVVLPRRWVVERTLSWLTKARRNVRDYERLPQHAEAHLNWAAITLMTRRMAHQTAE